MTSAPSLYRPCVGIALFNRHGLVFVGERIDTPGSWQMPQGGINKKEDIKKAALRELLEEIGTDKATILHVIEKPIRYDLPDELRERLWRGKFAGQEQTWVAARFDGNDSDIKLDQDFGAPPEFNAWKWVPLDQTVDLIVPFKRETYRKVVEMLRPFSQLTS